MRFTDIKKFVTESKEQLEDRLYDLEAAVRSARDITKQIKYADTHLDVIRELQELAEKVGIELDEYNVRQVYQANNNLESAVYELEEVFEEAVREIQMKIDDLEFEEGKSPHKKGTKKYKKHMAAMHAESSSFRKESLEALARHVKEGIPLPDSLFRYQSEAYFDTFRQAKQLREMGSLPELDWESEEMLGTDIGESVALKGIGTVWLDVPYLDESEDPVRDIINRNGGSKLLQQYADGEKQFYNSQMFDELYDYYSNSGDMPYGTMTGDDGDAEVWILDKLETEGYVDHPSDSPEDCMACGGTGFDRDQPEKSCKACDGEGYDDGYFGGTKAYEDINKMRKLAGLPEAEYQGKDVELNKPKRGGSKKYYVYVKNPKTGKVKKISFGDPGLKTKSGNKSRAKSFAARHNCEKKNDKMKAGYWACRLPRYGLVKGGKWW